MSSDATEVKVLAIASHVTYGYVGNKMATFVMQALGCDVSAINTVNFSNHTAYKQFKGRKVPAEEIEELYEGLKQSDLNDFDMLLSGYIASKDAVKAVGKIGRDLRLRANIKPGSFFWCLDPVMGDEGRLYVNEDIVPAYRTLLNDADLILPNAFEAELLSEIKITDMASLTAAITKLHKTYQIPHILVTSLRLPTEAAEASKSQEGLRESLIVVGSSCRSDFSPRIFSITAPSLPIFFSGTGDMFAALTTVRLREAVTQASPELITKKAWVSPDDVAATELPLAKATEKTLASMHAVLVKTVEAMEKELGAASVADAEGEEDEKERRKAHLKQTRASEIRVVSCVDALQNPPVRGENGVKFEAVAVEVKEEA